MKDPRHDGKGINSPRKLIRFQQPTHFVKCAHLDRRHFGRGGAVRLRGSGELFLVSRDLEHPQALAHHLALEDRRVRGGAHEDPLHFRNLRLLVKFQFADELFELGGLARGQLRAAAGPRTSSSAALERNDEEQGNRQFRQQDGPPESADGDPITAVAVREDRSGLAFSSRPPSRRVVSRWVTQCRAASSKAWTTPVGCGASR